MPLTANPVANLRFMPIFARLRSVPLAAAGIVIVGAILVWSVVAVWRHYRWVAAAQWPFFVRMCTATVYCRSRR
ncbi:MAG: hypothetical protein ACJ8F7_00715 [Gemmataceae bacterium]